MPRRARIEIPGALHHIIVKGIEGREIFHDDTDRDRFLNRLGIVLTDTKIPCFAWALMPNHFHLLLGTGIVPIAHLMRRILTGYARCFNRRHGRHGRLFQNRYKSILCQKEPYLTELARYIHLNPLRGGLAPDLKRLDTYPYCGHCALMGKKKYDWQDTDHVLGLYGGTFSLARRRYRLHVKKGIGDGPRPDLTGGGLIRSAGGWTKVKALRKNENALPAKGDERILGDGDFVEKVLKQARESLKEKRNLKALGLDFDWLVAYVAKAMGIEPCDVLTRGKHKQRVKARDLLCHWSMKELEMTTVELAGRLRLTQPTISQSAMRGLKIAEAEGWRIPDPVY